MQTRQLSASSTLPRHDSLVEGAGSHPRSPVRIDKATTGRAIVSVAHGARRGRTLLPWTHKDQTIALAGTPESGECLFKCRGNKTNG
jgi:hypothetical protein